MQEKLVKRVALALGLVVVVVAFAAPSILPGATVDQALHLLQDWFPYN